MIRIFFGNIGSGKTTFAARQFYKLLRSDEKLKLKNKCSNYDYYFSNFPCSLSAEINLEGLGSWTFPENSYVIVDESGIEYNSRKFKSLPQETIAWLKLSRHFGCDVDFISQSFEDMDITIRRLASELWYIKKLGPFTLLRRIYKRVGIDEETHQIVDFYEFGKLLFSLLPPPFHQHNFEIFLRSPYYKFFDSFANPGLPVINESNFYSKPFIISHLKWYGSRVKTLVVPISGKFLRNIKEKALRSKLLQKYFSPQRFTAQDEEKPTL